PTTCWNGPSCTGSSSQCQLAASVKIKGHQHYPNQTHSDPGPNWNWYTYYNLINNCGGPAPTPTALAVQQLGCPSLGVTLSWQNSGANWYVDVTDDPTFTN